MGACVCCGYDDGPGISVCTACGDAAAEREERDHFADVQEAERLTYLWPAPADYFDGPPLFDAREYA